MSVETLTVRHRLRRKEWRISNPSLAEPDLVVDVAERIWELIAD